MPWGQYGADEFGLICVEQRSNAFDSVDFDDRMGAGSRGGQFYAVFAIDCVDQVPRQAVGGAEDKVGSDVGERRPEVEADGQAGAIGFGAGGEVGVAKGDAGVRLAVDDEAGEGLLAAGEIVQADGLLPGFLEDFSEFFGLIDTEDERGGRELDDGSADLRIVLLRGDDEPDLRLEFAKDLFAQVASGEEDFEEVFGQDTRGGFFREEGLFVGVEFAEVAPEGGGSEFAGDGQVGQDSGSGSLGEAAFAGGDHQSVDCGVKLQFPAVDVEAEREPFRTAKRLLYRAGQQQVDDVGTGFEGLLRWWITVQHRHVDESPRGDFRARGLPGFLVVGDGVEDSGGARGEESFQRFRLVGEDQTVAGPGEELFAVEAPGGHVTGILLVEGSGFCCGGCGRCQVCAGGQFDHLLDNVERR